MDLKGLGNLTYSSFLMEVYSEYLLSWYQRRDIMKKTRFLDVCMWVYEYTVYILAGAVSGLILGYFL
jgi:hypothetical protein